MHERERVCGGGGTGYAKVCPTTKKADARRKGNHPKTNRGAPVTKESPQGVSTTACGGSVW